MDMKKLFNQLMRAAYGLGVVFLLAGMLLSAVNVPAMAQEETPAVPTEEITEEVIPTEAIELTLEGPVETEPTEEPVVEEASALVAAFSAAEMLETPDVKDIQFTDASTGEIVSWTWNFGDETLESNEQNPIHIYENSGEYTVSLTVADAAGMTAAVTSVVTITEDAAPVNSETTEEGTIEETVVEVVEALTEADQQLVNEQGEIISAASAEFSTAVANGDPFFWDSATNTWIGYTVDGTGCPANVTCLASATPFQAAVSAAPPGSTIYVAEGHYDEVVTITTENLSFVGFALINALLDGTIDWDTFISGYATVKEFILDANFGTTENVYADYVDVEDGGYLADGLNLVEDDGMVSADVQVIMDSSGEYLVIRDANHEGEPTYIWKCGEPQVGIYTNTTYEMVFKGPLSADILDYYTQPENEDKRGLGLSAEERLEDLVIAVNKIAELKAAGGYGWDATDEKLFYWYILGNTSAYGYDDLYASLPADMQTLVDEILAGNYDDIERSRKIWFLWPAGSHSPTDVQLSFINYEDTDHPNLLAGTGTCDWNMSEDDGLYAFTYTVDYVDMPSDGMLTLEYGSTYPTKDVAGDGTASFTIYAASDPGQLRVSASGTGIGNLAVMTASLSNTCPTASMDVTVDDCDTGIDNYLYDYTITPSGVPSGATITYSGPVSMTYAGEATIPVDNSPLTTLSASATLPNGYEIANDSATVTPDDTLMCEPSITVSGTCRDDVYGTPVEYTFTAAGTNLFGGSIYKQGTTQTFPITQTGPTITAVWSLDDRVYDEFTVEDAAALECTSSSLTASGTGCVLTDGGASLFYTYTVNYSGYVIGDDFWVDDTNDGIDNPRLVGEADVTGTFTFTSYEESVLITSVLGSVTATANTQLCPAPALAIEGECVANEAGTGFVYNYAITYNDLVGGSSIAYTSGSNSIGSYTIPGTGSPLDGTDERNGLTFNTLTATWLYALADRATHPTASATATVDPIVCPVLDLTLENTACKLEEDGGHVLDVWTVTNPGIRDVYFEWTSTSGESGSGTVLAYGTATFETLDPETTSVTLAWDEVSADSPIIEEQKVEVVAVPDLPCEHELEPLVILDPYCHLNENEEWQEIWKIQNPNNWALEVIYQVNGGGIQGPFEIPANSELAFALPLGENTVKAMWDSGKESVSSTAYLSYEMCEGTPYNPPDVPDVPYIPVTGAEPVLEAPASGGELLIPVTGADMSSPLVNAGFFYNLYTYIGLFFLGLGMVAQGIKNRLIH